MRLSMHLRNHTGRPRSPVNRIALREGIMWQRWVYSTLLALSVSFAAETNASIELVSRIEGQPTLVNGPNRGAGSPSISADGRYIAFSSGSSNLVGGDSNGGVGDIFVYDRDTNSTELVTPGGNGNSFNPSISADGRIVAFNSSANNLVDGDTNGDMFDTFVHNRDTNTTELLTAAGNGDSFDVALSANGRFVGFTSDADNLVNGDINNFRDVFVYDRNDGTTQRITAGGNGDSRGVSFSGDGRFVAFSSRSSNLVTGDVNGVNDIFIYDRDTNEIEIINPAANNNAASPSLSADGRFVAFNSFASNLVPGDTNSRSDIFLYDRDTASNEILTEGANSDSFEPAISADGAFVALRSRASNLDARDTNGVTDDIFIYNRQTRTRVLLTAGGNSISVFPSISGDGRFITFNTSANNLISGDNNNASDILVYNRLTEELERILSTDLQFEVAGGNNDSDTPSVSADGQFIAFESSATNLISGDNNGNRDIFVYNRNTGTNESLTPDGNAASIAPSISGDGQYVAFESSASNLVAGDLNGNSDVFVYDRDTQGIEILTSGGNANSRLPSISADGRFVAFESAASNLVIDDSNGNLPDVFLYDRTTSTTQLITRGGNSDSRAPAISGDGRFIAFASQASNLVAEDTTSNIFDVFVYDRISNTTELLTTAGNSSSLEPSISGNGQFVAFESHASNLATGDANGNTRDIFIHNRSDSTTQLLTAGTTADNFGNTSISSDGQKVVFSSDATNLVAADVNGRTDIFLFDQATDTIESVTQGADGASTEGVISAGGRAIAFTSRALNLANNGTNSTTDVFVSVSNDPPTALPLTITTNEDTPIAFRVSGSDPEGEELSFSVLTQPSNGELSGTQPNLVYTPTADFFGNDSFTFVANDGTGDSVPATVSISITSVNDAPIAIDESGLSTPEDTPFTITLTGTDIDGDALTYVITTAPTNGTLFGTAPDLIYSPADNFSGSDSFRFTVSDSDLESVAATVSITIAAVNDNPVAITQSLTTSSSTPLAVTLTGTDADNEPLDFTIVGFPANGNLSGDLPNLIYTPANNFAGTDSFTFTVSDVASTSEAATVSISVSEATAPPPPANNPPVATAQSVSTPRGTPISILLSGTDADGDSLTFNFETSPSNGSLTGTPPNLVYTPDTDFVGEDSFIFTVSDSLDTSAPETLSITVSDGTIQLFAAVLPASRSVEVGTTATAFATLINSGTVDAQACRVRLPDSLVAEFFYQTSDSESNELIGEPNQPTTITAGASQSFVFGITPTEALPATEVALVFECANANDAASFVGLNTLLLSASATPVADLIALVATTTNNGVMELGDNGGFFTAATINVGSTATIRVNADSGDATLPITLRLCQTDPLTSVCINPAAPTLEPVIVDIAAGDSPTFAVFASTSESIALDPANSRIFLRFRDELGEVRGATSVAVQNTPGP